MCDDVITYPVDSGGGPHWTDRDWDFHLQTETPQASPGRKKSRDWLKL